MACADDANARAKAIAVNLIIIHPPVSEPEAGSLYSCRSGRALIRINSRLKCTVERRVGIANWTKGKQVNEKIAHVDEAKDRC